MFFTNRPVQSPVEEIKAELQMLKAVSISKNLSKTEETIICRIKERTKELNLNNITRTKAYLDFYQRHPEIHWAFLAHMVSRNGGWSMTDLKGELLSRLLSKKEKVSYFSFLERGNWLIFQDAYPQLLLYEESQKRKEPLFKLLGPLNISIFMEGMWNYYWKRQDSALLTIGLIVNEQNYIQNRVIQNQLYMKGVFDTFEFEIQDLLSFNQILFPYKLYGATRLAGQTVNQFKSLDERIQLGKRLYAILFDHDVLSHAVDWALVHPHTASRKDYWPDIFNDVNEGIPKLKYQIKLSACKKKSGASRIFSPALMNAWRDVKHEEAAPGDWFKSFKVLENLHKVEAPQVGNIEFDYCKTLERLELAALAKKITSIMD
ncbi:DUF2515 domain-containing protein [Mesobacillus subterraneus]|uniref:DUF2515 domain-containing protein n=1 Tax=Mesobacillus subterraneus TaxID=285983 RepID=A0A3R9EDT9_9BACI|nr:DUF2515 domain-containing protein [Mesobacillus subterraneus]